MSFFKDDTKDSPSLQFLRDSSMHGVKYLAQRQRPFTERITWICILLSSLAASAYFISGIIQKYIHNPVIVSFEPSQTSVSDVLFPAVTVCSANRLKKSVIHGLFESAQSEDSDTATNSRLTLRLLDHTCSLSNTFSNFFNYSINETRVNPCSRFGVGCGNDGTGFGSDYIKGIPDDAKFRLYLAMPNCQEMISLCLWEGRKQDCAKIFQPIVTDMGMCCIFNAVPRPYVIKDFVSWFGTRSLGKEEREFWKTFNFDDLLESDGKKDEDYEKYLSFQSKAGQGSGLSVLINMDLDEYFCDNHDSYGLRIHTNSPIEIPHVAEYGVSVGPNVEMFMSLQPEITKSDKEIRSMGENRRNCFFTHEQSLDSFHYYTKSNCLDQCFAEKIGLECNCVRMDLGMTFKKPSLANITVCEGIGLSCTKRVMIKLGKIGSDDVCPECRPSCNKIEYVSQLSSLPLRKDFTIKVQPTEEDEGNGTKNFVRPNASIVHIFFGSDNVYSKIRKSLYSFDDLFAHVGGILGLFLGMSVISVVEPVNILFRKYFGSKIGPQTGTKVENKNPKDSAAPANSNNRGFLMDSWKNKWSSYMHPDAKVYPFQH